VYYETVFIVNPDISQENTEKMTDALIQRVEKAGGRIVKREYWGSRPLAYQIAKRKRGHYVLLVTDGESSAVQTLEEGLRLEERVLRFLTTRLRELSDEPSPLLRRKSPASAESESAVEKEGIAEEEKVVEEKADAASTEAQTETAAVADNAGEQAAPAEEAGGDAAT